MAVELGSAAGKITIDASGVTAGIAEAQKSLQGAQSSFANVGASISQAGVGMMTLGAPLVAFGGIAAKVAGDFESQMNVLSVAAKGGSTSLEDLRSVAITAGQDVRLVGVSAADVAGAMTGFSKAGLDTNQMLGDMQGYLAGTTELGGALRAAIDLAAASELDLGQASDLVTITMNTFGLSSDQVVGAMSNYVQSADASVASVTDLRDAMINIGPTAAAFGFSLEDVNTALALLSTRGIVGAEAGTALKSMLVNIMRDAPEATKALKELNVSLYDQDGAMRPLPDIVADLSRALSGMTDEQRNNYVQTLAGSYGMKAMNTLLAEGADGWKTMESSIAGASTMQATAAAQTKGFNAAMENLKSSVETFLITAGTPLIENVLTPLIGILTDVMGKLAGMNPEWIKWAVIIGGVAVVLGGLLVAVGKVMSAISAISTVVGLLGPLFAGLGAALGPVLLIIAAVALVAGALYLAWKSNFLGIRDIVDGVGKTIKAVFDFIKGVIGNFLLFLKGEITFDEFVSRAQQSFENLKNFLANIWGQIGEKVSAAWETIKAIFARVLEAIKTVIIQKISEFIAPLVGGMENAKRIVTEAWTNIQTFLAGVWEGIKTSAAAAWEALKGIVRVAIEAVRTIIATVLALISGDWGTAWEGLKTGAGRIFGEIATAVGNVVETLRTGLAVKWESIRSGAVEKFEALRAGAAEKWESIRSGAVEKFEALRAGAAEKWETIWTTISGVVGRIKDFVVNTLGEIVTAAANLFGKIIEAISGGGAGEGAGGAGLGGLLNVAQLKATIVEVVTALQGMQVQIGLIWSAIQLSTTTTWTAMRLFFTTWLAALQLALTTAWLAIQLSTTTIWTAMQLFFTIWLAAELLAFQTWLSALQLVLTTAWAAIQLSTTTTWMAIQLQLATIWAAIVLQITTDITLIHKTVIDNYTGILGGIRALDTLLVLELTTQWGNMLQIVWTSAQQMHAVAVAETQAMCNEIIAIMRATVDGAYSAGRAMADAFGAGIKAGLESALSEARRLAQAIRDCLPGSDARTGPLSDLTASGKALPITLGKGIRAGVGSAVAAAEALAEGIKGKMRLPEWGDLAYEWRKATEGMTKGQMRLPEWGGAAYTSSNLLAGLPADLQALAGQFTHRVYGGLASAGSAAAGAAGAAAGAVSGAQDTLIAALDGLRGAVDKLTTALSGGLAEGLIKGKMRLPEWGDLAYEWRTQLDKATQGMTKGQMRLPEWGNSPQTSELITLLSGTPTTGLSAAVWGALMSILKPGQSASQPQSITVNVYNPVGEPTENSILRQLRTLSYVGVLG